MTPPTTPPGMYPIRPTMCDAARRLFSAHLKAQAARRVADKCDIETANQSPEVQSTWAAYRAHRRDCAECQKITAMIERESAEIAAEGQEQPCHAT